MQEILSLLRTFNSSDEESGRDEKSEEEDASASVEMLPHVDPLPFPSDSDRIREPTPEEFADLKKKLRTKLSSRRYSRRRKDDAKAQAALLSQHQEERSRLQTISATVMDVPTTQEERQRETERLHTELGMLLREAKSSAGQTFGLYEEAERMVHPHPDRGLAEHAIRPDHLSSVQPLQGDWSQSDQLDKAIANLRTIAAVLSGTQRDGSPSFALSVYKGWRIVECKRRGSRFCAQASKQIATISRHALSEHVWKNADDETKRVALCASFSRFTAVTSKKQLLDGASCVFYSEELHEFPAPFQCRAFTTLNGVHNDGDKWYYVKHSVHGKPPLLEGRSGDEIVGVILQDAPDGNGGTNGVHVKLVLLYDTQSVCHAEQIVCEDPPVSHRVLSQWEQNHCVVPSLSE